METKFQTSFIPKTTILAPDVPQARVKRGPGVLVSLSFLILLASLLFSASLVFWGIYLEKSKIALDNDLKKNIESFERKTIEEYARLDTRIDSARGLLENHIAPSYFLEFLQTETLRSEKFYDLKYELSADGKFATVDMSGVAKNYNSLAYQAKEFGKNRELIAPIFTDPDLDEQGNVVFVFNTKIDPRFIQYKKKAEEFKLLENTQVKNFDEPALPPEDFN